MGCLKQTLPWGDSTVIGHIFDTLQPHCGAGMTVVVGSHRKEITAALSDRSFSIVQSDTNLQQYESICRGLDYFIHETEAFFALIQPADHPFIPSIVVNTLFENLLVMEHQQQTAIIPTYQNRGGHPVLIPRAVAAEILSWAQTIPTTTSPSHSPPTDTNKSSQFQGLKTFWQEHPDCVQRIETNEHSITTDLDTPTDYQQHHP